VAKILLTNVFKQDHCCSSAKIGSEIQCGIQLRSLDADENTK